MIDSATLVHGIHFAATLSAAGACFFVRVIAKPSLARSVPDAGSQPPLERVAAAAIAALTLLALVTGILWLLVASASMSGRSMRDALDPAILGVVVTQTLFGKVWLLRLALCAGLLLIMLGACASRRFGNSLLVWNVATLCGVLLAGALAGASHAAADDGPFHVHLVADVLHLLAAAAWLGSLLPLAYVLASAYRHPAGTRFDLARAATDRFSPIGVASVATLAATGIVNSWFLVGTIPALIGTDYGRLLLLKLALFAAMIGFASINRWPLTPRLALDHEQGSLLAARALCRNACLEYGLGFAVLLVVGALNVSVPAAHDAVVWPFSFTLRPNELAESEHATAIIVGVLLLAAAGVGVAAWARRSRSPWRMAIGVGMVGAATALVATAMTDEAFPTTYLASPRPFSAATIARGAKVYSDNCAACHGADGYGDGPLAASLPIKPANLAAGHLLHHQDGDLFWWISNGIASSPMPAFASVLPRNDRWDVIDFLHVQAEAETAKRLTASVEPWQPLVAPNFDYEIDHENQRSLLALRGQSAVLLVLYTWPGSQPRLESLLAARARIEAAGARILAFPTTGPSQTGAIFAHANPDLVATYGLFRRTLAGQATPPMPAHLEFLIDRQGYLRARWTDPESAGWSNIGSLLGALEQLRRERPHPPAPLVSGHVH